MKSLYTAGPLPFSTSKRERYFVRATCQRPQARQNSITEMIRKKSNNRDDRESLIRTEFGLQVREEMALVKAPVLPSPLSSHPGQIEKVLRDIHKMSVQKGRQLKLLIVILPDFSDSSYGKIKRTCETELGIVSQCCEPKKVKTFNTQYLESLALKINVKVGGRNTVLNDAICKKLPVVTDGVPTIIFGADVTHPAAGDDSSPSVAAVVGSTDWPEVTNYRAIVSAQPHRDEIIKDLYKSHKSEKDLVPGGMIRELLVAFYKQNRLKPYRDGVSEGQFSQVLLYEMDAIRRGTSRPAHYHAVSLPIVCKF